MHSRWQGGERSSRSPRTARALAMVLFLGSGGLSGCATTSVSNLDALESIDMNRVVPYPEEEDLRRRAFEVIVIDRPSSTGIESERLVDAHDWAKRELESIAGDTGAVLIARSVEGLREMRTEGTPWESDVTSDDSLQGDFALATRFAVYRDAATWKAPFKFLWQSPEEVSEKPGTCTHRADVDFEVDVVDLGNWHQVTKTYRLVHGAEREYKERDPNCPLDPESREAGPLFEAALTEALGCLQIPLGRVLAPRGHVNQHRREPESDRHLYRISLGRAQGIEPGDEIEIRREQRTLTPAGDELRSERVIASGVVTDQIKPQFSWIALDPTRARDEILDGDVARPVLRQGLLSSLSGPDCDAILTSPPDA